MRLRLWDREPATTLRDVRDTSLFRGALVEIAMKDAEIARLKALLAAHGIKDEAASS